MKERKKRVQRGQKEEEEMIDLLRWEERKVGVSRVEEEVVWWREEWGLMIFARTSYFRLD
jgi:hypothetical protein